MEIPDAKELEQEVFAISNEKQFHTIALEVFRFQFQYNPVYRSYCQAIGKEVDRVKEIKDIPFLPIGIFKTHRVQTTSFTPELVFRSSGTTGSVTSSHFVKKARLYERSFETGFGKFFGPAKQYCIIGLLPSYLERGNSSLVYMVDRLVKESGHPLSGFYLYEFEKLNATLEKLQAAAQKTILIGVTYALLDFGDQFPQQLENTMVMETGGMKGRGREMTKAELHTHLKTCLGLSHIHSEYGMTELLSQAYGIDGILQTPPWMKVLLRDETDPFTLYEAEQSRSGVINVIDLANVYSCSFIATEDLGKTHGSRGFEVLGRMDHSDIRGCSLMVV